jgi:peptidoglycan/LPS O-acetylase OafA/YrhL
VTAATTPDERWRLGYRPALDGLRGLAIAMVLLGHGRIPGWHAPSTVGVTLFFVLSGFLITTLLIEERERTGRIDIVAFYKRRARRLLPALFAFLAVMAVLLAARGVDVVGTIVPPILYYANWVLVLGGELPLVGHTWSLSVEEQFYIVWPAMLIVLLAVGQYRRLAIGLLLATVAVAAWRFILWDSSTIERIARATDTRADALLIGCAVAFLFAIRARTVPGWAVLVAVAMVGTAMAIELAIVRYAIGLSLTAVGGAVLVALAASRGVRVLEWRPLVWLGSISYGLYLWQTPTIAIARRAIEPEPLGVVIGIAAAVALATLSRRFVEMPFLRRRHASGETQVAALRPG